MGDDGRPEPNRVFGIPVRPPGTEQREGEEPQRVMGFPVDWFGPANGQVLDWIAHPVREFRRRAERRRSGA